MLHNGIVCLFRAKEVEEKHETFVCLFQEKKGLFQEQAENKFLFVCFGQKKRSRRKTSNFCLFVSRMVCFQEEKKTTNN